MTLKNFTRIIILQEERDYRCIIVCLFFFQKKAAFTSLPMQKQNNLKLCSVHWSLNSIKLQRPVCGTQFQVILGQKIHEKGKQRGS